MPSASKRGGGNGWRKFSIPTSDDGEDMTCTFADEFSLLTGLMLKRNAELLKRSRTEETESSGSLAIKLSGPN